METESISKVLYTLEPGGFFTTKDFEEGVQTLDTAITEMSVINIH